MEAELALSLRVVSGRERECAEFLRAQVTGKHWRVLVTLAAELVQIHEAAALGSAVVVVTGSSQAERVLKDLNRDQPARVPEL